MEERKGEMSIRGSDVGAIVDMVVISYVRSRRFLWFKDLLSGGSCRDGSRKRKLPQ